MKQTDLSKGYFQAQKQPKTDYAVIDYQRSNALKT